MFKIIFWFLKLETSSHDVDDFQDYLFWVLKVMHRDSEAANIQFEIYFKEYRASLLHFNFNRKCIVFLVL